MTLRESTHEVVRTETAHGEVTVELYLKYPLDADGNVIIDAVLQAASAVLSRVDPAPSLQLMALPHLQGEPA